MSVKNNCACWCHSPQSVIHNFENECNCICRHFPKNVNYSQAYFEKNHTQNNNEHEDVSPMVKQMQVLEKRIAEIETVKGIVAPAIDKTLCEFQNRIEKLEQHKNYQIDENRKESKRLDEVEMFGASNSDAIEDLAKKVDSLQEWQNKFLDEIGALSLKVNQQNSSLREFEKQRIDPKFDNFWISIARIDNRIDKLTECFSVSKRPHVCPVCNGTSFCAEGMDCKACDGSCVVWG